MALASEMPMTNYQLQCRRTLDKSMWKATSHTNAAQAPRALFVRQQTKQSHGVVHLGGRAHTGKVLRLVHEREDPEDGAAGAQLVDDAALHALPRLAAIRDRAARRHLHHARPARAASIATCAQERAMCSNVQTAPKAPRRKLHTQHDVHENGMRRLNQMLRGAAGAAGAQASTSASSC